MLTLNQMLTLNGVKLSLTQPTNRLARYADQQTLFRYPKERTEKFSRGLNISRF